MRRVKYGWGYHSSDEQSVHVSREHEGGRIEDLFDVALYDPEVTDPDTGLDCLTQSRNDLRVLIGFANAALTAGLEPEFVNDRTEVDEIVPDGI